MKKQEAIWQNETSETVREWSGGALYCSDAIDFLSSFQAEIADIVFLDPPFNLGKQYGSRGNSEDLMDENDYVIFLRSILTESTRILKHGGALYLYHIPQWALRFGSFIEKNLSFRHWIAISMKNGFARGEHLYPAHYALLYFTKGLPSYFKRPKVPTPTCRHCGEYVKDYGGYIQFVRDGLNLSDIWDDLSPVRHKNRKNRSENELPLELLRRVLEISGQKDGLLVDPFVGSGTSLVAATEHEMLFLGCDRDPTCCGVAAKRLDEYFRLSESLVVLN